IDHERLVGWLVGRGRRVVYTPDASVAETPPPILEPHLRGTYEHARARGAAARRSSGRSLSLATTLSLLPIACATVGVVLVALGLTTFGLALVVAYVAALAGSAAHAAIRFRS